MAMSWIIRRKQFTAALPVNPFPLDGSLRDMLTYLGETTVNYEVSCIDEAALVTGEEDYSLGLLNCFAKASSRKVNLAAVPFGLVITEPVL